MRIGRSSKPSKATVSSCAPVSAATTTVTVSNLSFAVGSTLTFANTGSAGTLTVSATSVTGSLSGTLTATLPGVALTGSFALDLLTDADPSAAQHVWLTATNASLTIAGQQIAADALGGSRFSGAWGPGVAVGAVGKDVARLLLAAVEKLPALGPYQARRVIGPVIIAASNGR